MASPLQGDLFYAWEKYMDCRLQGADLQVSLQSLENFLCLFHYVQHHPHHTKDALKFCSDMSGASNTLAREFLTDVHQLCSAVAQRAEAREEDEEESHMVALGEYLVRGRGFLLLSTLDSIIDQELTCREELLTLLLSLLPLVWKIPVQEEKAPDFTLPSLLQVFLSREVKAVPLRAGQKTGVDDQESGKRPRVGSGTWKSRRSRRTAQKYAVKDARRAQVSTSDSEANTEDKAGPGGSRSRRSHGSTIRVSCQHHRLETTQLTATATTETMSAPYPHPRVHGSQTMDTETLTDPAAMSIFNRMENSPFDLCYVLLSLLEKVCKFDMSINHNPSLAVSVVPTLTEILTEFGDCCGPGSSGGTGAEELAGGWTEEPIALVQRMLLRTILHLMSVDVSQSEKLPDSLRRSLTDLLRATLKIRSCLDRKTNPFAPRPKKTLQEVQDDFSFSRFRHRALLLPELLEGVLQVLLSCLQASTPNPFFFSQALDLIHEFVQHRGLELFEATVLRLEELGRAPDLEVGGEASERLRGLVAGVFKIISAVKKAKSEQLHQSVCARRRHRRCEYSHFLHHHRDLSGLPASAFKKVAWRNPFEEDTEGKEGMEGDAVRYPERCCCLAACAHQCLRLLQRLSPSGPAVLQVLAGVQAVGICCCMDPRSVIRPLLDAFQAPDLRSYQSHVLSVLGRLILEQLGGGQPSERAKLASCNICTLDQSQLPVLEETLQHGEPSALSTSLCYRSQGILPSGGGAEDMLWKWDALEAYQKLVFGEDRQLSQQVAGHVCHLTLRGNAVVQWQLYTHIFSPVLQRGVELAHHALQLGVSTVCTQVCSYHTQCLPVEVLLIYLQALPALLKSRVIRDLFISCNGLNQMTELVYLDQTCSLALKVFETLITSFGRQEADNVLQELEVAVAEQKQTISNLAEDPGSRGSGEGPQSLSKFYEGLKEGYPRHKSRSGQGRGAGRSQAETHLHVINLFLCVAFLCVSKEADSDRDSANDSEDTSGYDSTASEPLGGRLAYLSPDSVTLPSKEQVRRAADVWSVCRCVYLANPLFQRQFFRLGGLNVCLRLMSMVIQKLSCKNKDGKAKKKKEFKSKSSPESTVFVSLDKPGLKSIHCTPPAEGKTKDPTKRQEEEWQLQSIRLLEALLAICLHGANSAHQKTDSELSYQLQSVDHTLLEVRDQLSRSGVISSDLAVPLFDSLLRVALANVLPSSEPPEEKPDRKLQVLAEGAAPAGDLSEEVDGVQSCGVKPLGEEEEEGYDADSESNPEDMANQENGLKVETVQWQFATVADCPGRGLLLFPEICTVELQLLATGSPDLELLSHVFQSLLCAVRTNHRNAALLYDQGVVKTILSGFHDILCQADSYLTDCQTVIVELLVAMMSQRITAEELALLIRLFLDQTPPTEILLKGILQIVEANVNVEPLHQLDFPIIIGALTPGGASPSSRPNGNAGGNSVSLLWKGKLSPGRREGDSEIRPSHLRSSPWNTAPLHLPLVGQNCWPHMASGFSASMWLKVVEQEEKEGNTEKEKRNIPAADSHHGSPQAGRRVVEESLIHILSMGSKALMLQVWADFSTGSLTFRVCIDPNDEIKAGLLAQADSGEGLLRPGQWQHLGLTYTQQPEGKKNIHGRVVVWVCGIMKCDVFLDYTLPRKSSLSSDSNKTFCMLGHCITSSEEVSKQRVHWSMGTVLLFNGARVGSDEAFFLYTSGPDLASIMPCNYGKPTGSFSKFVTQEGLRCERVRELLMKSKDVDTTALVESLAVVYAPNSPRVYTIYEPVIRLKGQAKTVVTQRPFSSKEVQSVSLEPNTLKALLPTETHGLQSVLHKIGGTGNFVFLFAQTVELSDCEMTQALALQILLSLSKFNQHRIHEMDCYHGYSMIHQVLIKSKCVVGYHMLKTLLDGCCSGPILILEDDGQFRLDTESIAVVQDIRLLSDVLLDWKIWAKAECGVWEILLAALEILIRVHHPYQVFNIRQFLKAEVVHRFLLTCQVLQEHRDDHLTAIPQEVCMSFVKITQEVLGSPPDLDLLKLIYNFLLAVHPPTNTYVCHTPSSFYFSLHIDGKLYNDKLQSIMYLRHSNSGGKSASSSVVSLSPTVFTEAPQEGTLPVPSPEHGGDDQSLCPPSLAPSPYTSPLLTPRLAHSGSNEAGDVERLSLATQQALGSTETLKKGGGGGDEQLLSSCESAKTICDSKEISKDGAPRTPSISIEEERDEAAEVDSLAEGSVGVAESEDRFDWASDEAPRRPDSLKGIQSFQRSHSNLASLGLAFPAPNGSLAISRWPSAADRSSVPEDWESYTYSPGYQRTHSKTDSNDRSSTEDCLVLICCGLYDLLKGVLLLLPDLMLEEVMDKLIQPEALIVLVNHSSPLIQQGVMKLLDAYFSRANKEQKEKFLKNHGFSLLANQLYIHQGSQGLIECFLEMLFGRPVGMEEDLDLDEMETISPFTKRCIIPVLGLIENSLCENSLVHNILCMLLQLLNACPKLADILLDHGLLYVLFNTLSTLNGLETGIPPNDYKLLVCDIQQLLVAVTIHSCSSSGSQYFRIIEDLITLLGFMQTSKMRRTQEMAVALQFRVLQSAIEFIKTTANQEPQKLSSSHNAPSSPHHAIYQKRKSIAGSIALKDSIIPRIPRQHYCSYGQIPLPSHFNFLPQDSPTPSPTGSPSYMLHCEAGRRRFSLAQTDSLLVRMRSVASDELNQMMQRRMSQENPIRASETEFVQRLQRLVVLAVNRLIYHDVSQDLFDLLNIPDSPDQQLFTPEPGDQTHEESDSASAPHSPIPFTLPPASKKSLQKDILKLMMDGIKISLGSTGRGGAPRQQWQRILWSCRDTFRVQIGRLLVHTLSPTRPLCDRKEALEFVFDRRHLDILKESLSPGLEHGPKLSLYLYEMLHDHKDCLTKDEQNAVSVFMTSLKLCGHRCIPLNVLHKQDLLKAIKEENFKYEAEEKTSKVAWEKKMTNTQRNLIQRLDGKSKDISKIAADITQNVSLRQGMERKKVIQHIRGLYKTDLSASRHWQELVQQLTHDRAVWYDQTSYPTSWQLDPTEGPNRERRRLQRCYLTIPNKYLLKDRRKPEDTVKPPLSFLFEDKTHSSFSSTVKDKATSEPIRFTRRCISVAPSRETAGELLLGKSGMYFVEDNAADAHDSQSLHGETEAPSFSWTYEEIKEVHKRWWQLRDNAVEIFLTNGRTLLLAFDNNKFRDDVYHNILTSDLPNLLEHGNITPLTQLWGSGQISNFEYLTHLNKHAGRSFNDLMQYPVFPFILRDYTSETLDLQDSTIYRNLSKPIAVQSKEKEDRYVDNYRYLEEEYRKGIREDDPMPPVQPYHYGSHYSNSGTVLHFLVRMPPFTKMFLAYQDQSFDIPDRTFHSMNTTWRLSSYESMTDVKELIPEFFYLPEFLVNREGFDFGVRQNSERVNHVNLPPWARNDPRLFILIHRQALESDQVSQTLCQWIDLVFGLKQKGKAAVHAINVFHPATYFGMDVSSVEDPVQRRALETMIKTYGQTPRQLFNTSHVSRAGPKLMMEGELPAAMGLLVQLAFRETREQAKEIICPSPLPWIKGLKWGEYVGSPSAPDPVVCFSQPHGERFGSLLALPTRAICGLSRKFCLMMIYSKEQGVRSMHSTDIQWSAILSWGYADNILRLKSKQSEPPINFVQCSPLHQVTSCAWVPDGCQLFTGSKCGVITAYSNRFTSTTLTEMEVEAQVHLYGHTGKVTSLFVCKPYSILISVSTDGTCILWDLNRLCYVQSLTGHKSPVTAVSASETTGDIATVCDSVGGGSDLRLWTVNGDLIGHVHCREIICSVAFSNQPEGVSVNVIAGGLENGVVRLWSTWDLKPVREITFPKSCKPIISLTYSCDGHHLYTANSEGTVMAWCRRDQQRMKLPMFYSFLSSYAAG
ncbi:lysosomal-trafficking regulator isoform X1 [Entelurus aequoreus]|uniref:lysosomal-trafficking regulator isoform X1 n=1 Tax=Entelurus aequoreus TaxID=161455 RepID=UPI002B1E8D33|nr:lysosomal-trafficking regulator isoform X1 [Entelurus aequoreus]XP_061914505.1 lysosomal-trafficking regulator isoform X1 [Entelurus aequoreus]XP_061914506.1 lysosomal-trafficking regulator isoform X1 [Entelurus aequoreus]XP_061914507.1 lysosomal-trafficking regulator isoform X1 [Entelurus aequoreus]XP_061914508.1 lysosomal-trafficking regulator isoform X1 [Entelurus aequoreus]